MPNFKRVAENLAVNTDSGIYYLSAKIAGKKLRKSLRTSTLKIAKMKRDDMLRKLRAQSAVVKDSKNITLGELCVLAREYYANLPSYQKKPRSLHYREYMLKIIQDTLPNRAISTLSKKEIVDWWSSDKISGYSDQIRNNVLGTLRKVFDIAIDMHARIDDPTASLNRAKIRKPRISVPTSDEFRAIVKDIRNQGKRLSLESSQFVEFKAYSGLRREEMLGVLPEDILEDQIRVRGGRFGTKNLEERFAPIVPAMRDLLERIEINPAKPLFSFIPNRALTNACKRLGIKHVRIHDLRHLFATTCIESGIDFATVGRWLGHKDGGILAAKTYGHIRDEHSQREAAKVVF